MCHIYSYLRNLFQKTSKRLQCKRLKRGVSAKETTRICRNQAARLQNRTAEFSPVIRDHVLASRISSGGLLGRAWWFDKFDNDFGSHFDPQVVHTEDGGIVGNQCTYASGLFLMGAWAILGLNIWSVHQNMTPLEILQAQDLVVLLMTDRIAQLIQPC